MKINGNPSEKLSAEHHPTKLQVHQNNEDSPKRSKKRKSFSKKKKRKRAKQEKNRNGRIIQHRHQDLIRSEENTFSAATNKCKFEIFPYRKILSNQSRIINSKRKFIVRCCIILPVRLHLLKINSDEKFFFNKNSFTSFLMRCFLMHLIIVLSSSSCSLIETLTAPN